MAGAATLDDLEKAANPYLGRKSPLKLALREVRDRETGMTLNEVRERIEHELEERRRQIEEPLAPEVDVTLPGELLERLEGLPPRRQRRAVHETLAAAGKIGRHLGANQMHAGA